MPDLWMDVDAALAEVPVNIMPLIDDTDFKSREVAIVFNQAGMDLVWNFTTPAGAMTQTAVVPTAAGDYDWAHQGDGMYSIEIPAVGGASINNNTEGFGWFTGFCTGVLPWRGPVIGLRAAGLNNLLIESAFSATRGLAGTALPDAAADAATGLPVSDAGGLDMDAKLANTNEVTAARLSELDAGTGGKMANQVDEIRTDTEDLQTQVGVAGVGLTALGGMSAGMKGEIQSEAEDAIDAKKPTNWGSMGIEADGDVHADLKEWLGAVPLTLFANRLQVYVGQMAANTVTAIAISANAIDSTVLAASAVQEIADGVWDEDIEAAHGGDASAGLLLRILGASISNRANNATLDALLGVVDAAGRDLPEQTWLEATRTLTALGFNLANTDFAAGAINAAAIAAGAITAVEAPNLDAAISSRSSHNAAAIWAVAVRNLTALGFNLGTADFQANYLTAALIANGAIDAATFAAGALNAAALATDAAEEIADALIGRNIAGGSNVGRLVSDALAILRNRRRIAAGIMTVYQADDTTPLWTAGVVTAPGNPVTDIDPV